jgi:triosephosphate isomerase
MSRRKIVAGNWKMNLDRARATELAAAVAARATEAGATELVLCPPAVYIETVGATLAAAKSPVALGGQNMHDKASGAFTGEVAPQMLLDLGCRYVILGHSERRTLFGETDAIVNAKTKSALAAGLIPIVCVGELLDEVVRLVPPPLGDPAAPARRVRAACRRTRPRAGCALRARP